MIPREPFQPSAAIPAATPARIASRAGLVAAWVIVALVALDLLGAALALMMR